jgi:hypothetical protein
MADDVFRSAGPQQPAPNINKNTKITTEELGTTTEENMIDVEIEDNKNLINKESYVHPSTTGTVATMTKTAPQHTNYQIECPSTPYTSNTNNGKLISSSTSYLTKTPPSSTSTADMVIDEPSTGRPSTLESTPRRQFRRKQNDRPATMLSTPVNKSRSPQQTQPPLKPFVLGSPKLNMSSLATAVTIAQAQIMPDLNIPNTSDDSDMINQKSSPDSMDIGDVSKNQIKLMTKSILYPYMKRTLWHIFPITLHLPIRMSVRKTLQIKLY